MKAFLIFFFKKTGESVFVPFPSLLSIVVAKYAWIVYVSGLEAVGSGNLSFQDSFMIGNWKVWKCSLSKFSVVVLGEGR